MTRYAVIVNRPGYLPDYMDDLDDFDDIDDAARYGAELISDRADRAQTTRGDMDRWRDVLRTGAALYFDDEIDGQEYAVQIHEVTA